MVSLDLSDTQIQVAILSGLFNVLSVLIASIAAAIIGKSISNRKRIKEDLRAAIDDINFLLQVEKQHCEHNQYSFGESRKNIVRDATRNLGLSFSGNFTPGRVRSDNRY